MSDADRHDSTEERPTAVSRHDWPTYGPYKVEACIGSGGQGEVFLARDSRLDRSVAIKRTTLSHDRTTRLRFEREIRTAAKLVHPRVATVFDVIDSPEGHMLVMEFVDGQPIHRHVRERGRSLPLIHRLARQVAEALVAIHGAGFVHRDLKPANVFVTRNDDVKVMDFGIARGTSASSLSQGEPPAETASTEVKLTRAGRITGTPGYTSPEQLRGEPLDARSDLFAFGVMLFELITGEHPFRRPTPQEISAAVQEAPAGTRESRALLRRSGGLNKIVGHLLEKSREDRPASAEAVLAELDALEERENRSRAWRPALAFAAIALGAAGLWALRTERGSGPPPSLHAAPMGRASVAVLPFEFAGAGDGEGGYGRMVADLLAGELSETESMRGVASYRVDELMADLQSGTPTSERLERIDAGLEPDYIVTGRVHREGDEYLATVDLHPRGDAAETASFALRARRCASLAAQAVQAILRATGGEGAPGERGRASASSRPLSDRSRALLERAERLLHERNLSEATSLLRKAIDLEPDFIEARILLIEALHSAGFEGEALELAADLETKLDELGIDADSRVALEARALLAALHNRRERHFELRRTLYERYADEPEVGLSYAMALFGMNQREEALSVLDDLVAREPMNARLLLSRARLLADLESFDEALESLDRAENEFRMLELEGGTAEAAEARAYVHFVRLEYQEARAEYLRAAEMFETAELPVRAHAARKSAADMALQSYLLDEASRGYAVALEGLREAGHYSQVVTALAGMGGLELREGRVVEAEKRLRRAIAQADELGSDTLRVVPQLTLASVYVSTGRTELAMTEAGDLHRRARGLGYAAYEKYAGTVMAIAHAHEMRFDEALDALESLLTDAHPMNRAYGSLVAAEIHELSGNHEEALREYSSAGSAYAGVSATESALATLGRARALASLAREGAADAYRAAREVGASLRSQDFVDASRLTRARLVRLGLLRRDEVDLAELARPELPPSDPRARCTLQRRLARLEEAELLIEMGEREAGRRLALQVQEHAWSSALDRQMAREVLNGRAS